jgi:protein-tyrosine phosphatase
VEHSGASTASIAAVAHATPGQPIHVQPVVAALRASGEDRIGWCCVKSVLFVCAGNICRSPMAEALFREIARSRPVLAGLEIGSAGTIALDGNGATADAIAAALEVFGLDLSPHRARNVQDLDADLLLTMDGTVTREVRRLGLNGRVELLGEYAGTGEIVHDPYGCSRDEYRSCARHLERLLLATADRLEREMAPE